MNNNMRGLVLCGGKGTRLAPITYHQPKSMVPVGNQTMVERAILAMKKAGIEKIGLVVQNGASDEIEALIGDGSQYDVEVSYIYQYKPDGTAAAVQQALSFIEGHSVTICLGDNLMGEHISELIANFPEQGADAIVVTQEVENPQDFGVVEVENGQVKRIEEKPEHPPSNQALTGISWFSAENIRKFVYLVKSLRNEYDLTDIFDKILKGERIFKKSTTKYLVVGCWDAKRLLVANQRVLDERTAAHSSHILLENDDIVLENCKITGPVAIGKGAKLQNVVLGPYTAIGNEVKLRNVRMENSIIMENTKIFDFGTKITDSIIGGNLTLRKEMSSKEIGDLLDRHAIAPDKIRLQMTLAQYENENPQGLQRIPDRLKGLFLPRPPQIEIDHPFPSGRESRTSRSIPEK